MGCAPRGGVQARLSLPVTGLNSYRVPVLGEGGPAASECERAGPELTETNRQCEAPFSLSQCGREPLLGIPSELEATQK